MVLFEKILNESNNNSNFIEAFAKKCINVLGMPLDSVNISQRNYDVDIAVFNKKSNTIFYHSDLLYLPKPFVKSVIAHEVAHVAAGYDAGHGKKWLEKCYELEDAFSEEMYQIMPKLDDYDLDSMYYELKPGKIITGILKHAPELKGHTQITMDVFNGNLCTTDENDETLMIRPTLFCANDTTYISKDDEEDILLCIEDVCDTWRQ